MDSNLLIAWGATSKIFDKGTYIFHEGEEARFYFQIETGSVKMTNIGDDLKEFIQGVFNDGESFGEPPLLINEKYPASAIATKKSVIYRLSKDRFFQILNEYRRVESELLKLLAKRIHAKAINTSGIVNHIPEERIISLLKEYKKKIGEHTSKVIIPYTRQEIANFTGLRVETVIRTLSVLRDKNLVDIINRKLYY